MIDWTFVFTVISSLAAVAAAIAAWQAARETRRTIATQVVMEIRKSYASPEMFSAMRILRNWQKEQGSEFAIKFGKLMQSNPTEVESIHQARRRVAHHFHMLRFLLESNTIDRSLLVSIVPNDEIEILLECVDPLDRQLPPYDSKTHDIFRNIYERRIETSKAVKNRSEEKRNIN